MITFSRGIPYSSARFQNTLRNSKPILRLIWNPVFIKGEANHRCTIFFYQRKNIFHDLLFSVYGVYDRFSVIHTKSCFNSLRISRIDLQRKPRDRLKLFDHQRQHLYIIKRRDTDINIQDLRPGIDLFDRLR